MTPAEALQAELPRYCRGGTGTAPDREGMSTCPTCGERFCTVADTPRFPPHLLHPNGIVTFGFGGCQ